MKHNMSCAVILVLFALTSLVGAQENDFPVLKGPYLGQEPPGITPKIFAPRFVSRNGYFEHSAAIFTPDLREVYWSAKANGKRYYEMFVSEFKDDRWTEPRVVSFLETNYSQLGPAISPDGNELYFSKNYDIWVVKRQAAGWSEPEYVSDISVPDRYERICSVTRDGSLYFTVSTFNPRVDQIYVARRSADGFSEPTKLGVDFQSGYLSIGGVYVAPDESYMVLELQLDHSSSELFVSYNSGDNSWTPAINLPLGFGRFPGVSPDGLYLFYVTHSGINWVSTSLIEELKQNR